MASVAIVGLGAMGAAAAWHLARQGHRVVGLERFGAAGHDRGSSHGETRAIRLAYFEHESYVALARRAYAGWRALEAAAGETVLTITGMLESGAPGSRVVQDSLASCRLHGLPHRVMTPAEVARDFPAIRLPPDWSAVHTPDGGVLRPERAVALFCAEAARHGATLRFGAAVAAVEPRADGVRVVLADGEAILAERAILAAGAWMPGLVPALRPHLRVTRQGSIWLDPPRPALFAPGRFPVFLLDDARDTLYGFPDIAGGGVKVASHRAGEVVADPLALRREAGPGEAEAIRDGLARFMPDAAGAVRRFAACMYTRTVDDDFIVDLHPDDPRIVLASPCSGHGFKFAPVIGQALAELAVEGGTEVPVARFALGRFGLGRFGLGRFGLGRSG